MTALKEALDAASAPAAVLRPPDFAGLLRSFEAAAEKAVEPFNSLNAKPPEGVDLNELVRKARKRGIVRSGGGVSGLTSRELRLLAWALWRRVDGERIAEDAPLLAQYLRAVERLGKRSHFRALASSYLLNFAPDAAGVSAAAKTLRKLLDMDIAPPKWGEIHRRWDMFAGPGAIQMVARHFMSAGGGEQEIAEAAKRVGLEKMLAQGGMSRAAFCAALREYANAPNLESLRRLTAWRNFAAKGEGFCNSAYAEGLLLPWAGNAPPEDIKSETLDALLKSHKDPRVHGVGWASVNEDARNVMFRWLAGVSLEQFFHVIDKIGGEGRHMWPMRRKFWLAYHQRGHLSDAWVAFGGAGLDYLRGSRGVAYAALNGALHNHAVLLMRIGDLTIADWNQNGKCRMWRKSSRMAPKFYQPSYYAHNLRHGSNEDFRHDPQGHWRGNVARCIRDWTTGITVPFREFL